MAKEYLSLVAGRQERFFTINAGNDLKGALPSWF